MRSLCMSAPRIAGGDHGVSARGGIGSRQPPRVIPGSGGETPRREGRSEGLDSGPCGDGVARGQAREPGRAEWRAQARAGAGRKKERKGAGLTSGTGWSGGRASDAERGCALGCAR